MFLQNVTVLLQNATIITNCVDFVSNAKFITKLGWSIDKMVTFLNEI